MRITATLILFLLNTVCAQEDYLYDLYNLGMDKNDPVKGFFACEACKMGLASPDFILENTFIRKILEWVATEVCISLKIEKGIRSVCHGAVNEMSNSLLPAIAEGIISPQRVCSEYLQICKTPKVSHFNLDDYVTQRIAQKPAFIHNNSFVDDIYDKIEKDGHRRPIVRSIQFSDPHVDFEYREGLPAECDFPICCRDNGPLDHLALKNPRLAGKWGDYNCDLPYGTLVNMFEFVAKNQDTLKIDFITWTGDNSAHNVWSNSNQEITDYTINVTETMKQILPDIDVFPIQGNHDTWPVNVQDFSKENANWAINHFKDSWNDNNFLNDEQTEVFTKYGYYSKPFKFNSKGYVLGINMQACNDMNWWLLKNRDDPGHQIEWLEKELNRIENIGGFAYVIAHIPPKSCLHQYGMRFKVLMERYQHIVRFSSYGHSHNEQIFLTQAINTTKSIGFNLITGSGTTDGDRNPAFTVIDFDKEYMVPLNIHTYYMNLTEANLNDKPEWKVLHDFKTEYGLKNLSPSEMNKFIHRLANDPEVAAQYTWNMNRRVGPKPKKGKDQSYLCLLLSEAYEIADCHGSPHINLKSFSTTDWFNFLIGDWIKVQN